MEVWSWIINIPPGWQSLVISSDPCDGGLPMEKDPFASPKGTFTFHHGRVPNKSLHRSRDMGFDGMGVIWTLNVSPMRRCIHCHYFFAFKFYIFHIFSLTSTAMRRLLCSVSERISPPLLILRWWKLDTVFWHLPSSPLHRQFVMTLHAGLVRAHIPPSHPAPGPIPSYWFVCSRQPVKESVVIRLFQPLSFDVSLPPNERQSVCESLKRYVWSFQTDSSGRQALSPFMLFIRRTYSYQLWTPLHTRKYCH